MSGFSFQVAPKVLESALSKAAAVVATSNAPQGKNFMLEVEDKCLSVLAFSSDTFVRLRVTEAKAKGLACLALMLPASKASSRTDRKWNSTTTGQTARLRY